MKKKLSLIWFAGSVFVLPCILDLEKFGCVAAIMASLLLSFRMFKKYNPEYVLTNNKENDYGTETNDSKAAGESEKGCCD